MSGPSEHQHESSASGDDLHILTAQHSELEQRLHELAAKPYPSQEEQLEEATLKKRKLQVKDRMEDIVRRHRNESGTSDRPVDFRG